MSAEVAEAAARSLAELMGGAIHVSKSSKTETSSTTHVQGAGTAFLIGDSDAQEEQEATADGSGATASVCNTSSEAALGDSKMKEESTPQEESATGTVDDKSLASVGPS